MANRQWLLKQSNNRAYLGPGLRPFNSLTHMRANGPFGVDIIVNCYYQNSSGIGFLVQSRAFVVIEVGGEMTPKCKWPFISARRWG